MAQVRAVQLAEGGMSDPPTPTKNKSPTDREVQLAEGSLGLESRDSLARTIFCVSQPNLVQDLDRRAVHSNLSYLASNTSCEFSFRDDDDDSDLTIANSGC